MKIKLTNVLVDDQEKALRFYTGVLGFVKKNDVPAGQYRWLTVVSPEGPQDIELVLEPDANPASQAFKKALSEQGIPFIAFAVQDLQQEYERLRLQGVQFAVEPVDAGPTRIAIFDDTCGNLIQIYQEG